MDREILKFLYAFYKDGDYVNYHSLTPLFITLQKGKSYGHFLERLSLAINHLLMMNQLELEDFRFSEWGKPGEDTDTLIDFNTYDAFGKLTPEGAAWIESVIASEIQREAAKSSVTTNKVTKYSAMATLVLTCVVVAIQIRTCNREESQARQEADKKYIEARKQASQERHDSIFESTILRIIGRKTDSSKRR